MEQKHIRIDVVRKKDLIEFAATIPKKPEFSEVAPISFLRAKSQTKNPYAQDDDIVLIVAYGKNRCIGYHGLLPGLLKTDRAVFKIYWSTAIFVSPGFRGQGVMRRLFDRIKTLNEDFVVTGMNAPARKVYRRLGLKDLGRFSCYQLLPERLNMMGVFGSRLSAFLEGHGIQTRKLSALLGFLEDKIYSIQKRIFYRILLATEIKNVRDIRYHEVDQLTKAPPDNVLLKTNAPGFCRGVEGINWMVKHPWVASADKIGEEVKNYYFSTLRDTFKYIALEIFSKKEGSFKGHLVLSVIRKKNKAVVKMLDFYFEDPKDYCIGFVLTISYARAFLADQVEFPDNPARYFNNSVLIRHLIKKKDRLYLYFPKEGSSPLAACGGEMVFNYCDGDTAFT